MENSTEKITTLPEALIITIISILPLIDAIRLCSLSREWSHLWIYCKNIILDESYFIDSEAVNQLLSLRQYKQAATMKSEARKRFIDYVDQMIPLFKQPKLSKFSLKLVYEIGYQEFIESWVFAVTRKVEELHLDFYDGEGYQIFRAAYQPHFEMPGFLFLKNKSLRVLSLNFCSLSRLNFQYYTVLSSLSLTGVLVTESLVENLVTNCSVLQVFSLANSCIQGKFQFVSPTLSIKRLIIMGCEPFSHGIKLLAPKLQYFEYSGQLVEFHIAKLTELVEVVLDFRRESILPFHAARIHHVLKCLDTAKKLTLRTYIIKILPSHDSFIRLSCPLVNLVHLTLKTCMEECEMPGILCLLRSSPNLETLSIQKAYTDQIDKRFLSTMDTPEKAYWLQPSPFLYLKTIKAEGFTGSINETDLMFYLFKEAKILQQVIITPPKWCTTKPYSTIISNAVGCEELKTINSRHGALCSETSIFWYSGGMVSFIIKSLNNIEEVLLNFNISRYFHYETMEFLDLLWGFSRAKTLKLCSYVYKDYLAAVFAPVADDECQLIPRLPFFQLETIRIEQFTKTKWEIDLLKFLLSNARNLRIFATSSTWMSRAYEGLSNVKMVSRRAIIIYR